MLGSSRYFPALSRRSFSSLLYRDRTLVQATRRFVSISEERNGSDNRVQTCLKNSRISEGLSHHCHNSEIPVLESTIGKLLASAVEKWPSRECLVSVEQNERLSYSEVLQRADELAAGLFKLGLKRGDRIGLWGPNQIEWFISFMAMARAGFITVGINPAYQQSEIDYCLQKVGARAVIAPERFKTQNYAEMLLRAKNDHSSDLQHVIIIGNDHVSGTRRFADVESLASNSEVQAIAAMQDEVSPQGGCNIQFTSGTTGRPKATLLSHRSFLNNSRQGAARLGLMEEHHKICVNVPFFHAFGMLLGQLALLHSGATAIIESSSFNPKSSIETIVREKCTVTYGTPTMWINMLDAREKLKAPVKTLKCGITGGSIISPTFIRQIKQQLGCEGIGSIYGLTETTGISFQSLPSESNELTENTVGYLSDNIEAMVVDEKGVPVPVGSPGELWIRGYSTMMKYWDDEENTRKVLTEDGWLKTGDQFVLRSDGYGQVVGRLKDMIIRGGENIFPKEIEHLLESHPDVREAQVFGAYDPVYGEEICAGLRLTDNSKLTKDSLRAFCKGKIAHFKIPRYFVFVDSFPRTTSGKIQKMKMREELENRNVIPSSRNKQ